MLPRVVLHNAASVDGRFDWFTPDIGRFYELASRWREDATLVGTDTILAAEGADEDDEPSDPPRDELDDDSRPLLVIPDSRGRVRSWQYLRRQPYWRDTIALCSRSTPETYLDYLKERRIDCIVAGNDHVDLRAALEELNVRHDVQVVRVDSGGTLNGVLLRAGLVDEVSLLIHPCLVGGMTPKSIFRAPDLASADGVIQLRLAHVEQLEGELVWLRYEVVR
jgi:2,5-diamino-6-(ribosylamino)-4(3H)-pyrimidinone 5'-phosphate reductase